MRETILVSTCDHMNLMSFNVIYIYIMHVYVGDLVDASRCYWWIQHRTPEKKTLVKGPWSTTPFFLTAKRSQMLVAWYLHLDFFWYTYLLFLWFICQQTRCYGRYKVDISMEYIYIYFYARYLHFIMRYLNIVTVIFPRRLEFPGVTTLRTFLRCRAW